VNTVKLAFVHFSVAITVSKVAKADRERGGDSYTEKVCVYVWMFVWCVCVWVCDRVIERECVWVYEREYEHVWENMCVYLRERERENENHSVTMEKLKFWYTFKNWNCSLGHSKIGCYFTYVFNFFEMSMLYPTWHLLKAFWVQFVESNSKCYVPNWSLTSWC